MTTKSSIGMFSIFIVLIITTSTIIVSAQYFPSFTEKTTEIDIDSNGVFIATESIGISYDIQGTPGATGAVTTTIYNGNPQPSANYTDGIELSRFIVVVFNMEEEDFASATITFSYTDEDVESIQPPYKIFKYRPDSNVYIEIPSIVDTLAKTLTITLDSTDDPLFAIGGVTAKEEEGLPSTAWLIIGVIAVVAILIVVFVVALRSILKKQEQDTFYPI